MGAEKDGRSVKRVHRSTLAITPETSPRSTATCNGRLPSSRAWLDAAGRRIAHRRGLTKALGWAGLGVLWLASTALVGDTAMRAAEGWQGRVPIEALPSSHAIVVVSGMRVAPPGDAPLGEWAEAVDRFAAGIALFQAGKAPVLVCTGGWVPWSPGARPEGEVLAERAAMLGVPRRHMLVTNTVTNTADEARAVARHLRELPAITVDAPIILVTSAFHMRRSRVLCARAGFQVVPFPVDCRVSAGHAFTMLDLLPNANSLSQTEVALRELYGCLFYQLVGR